MIDDQLKKSKREADLAVMESLNVFAFKKSLLDQDFFYLCLLKIPEPVSEHIFERIKHRIVIVMTTE